MQTSQTLSSIDYTFVPSPSSSDRFSPHWPCVGYGGREDKENQPPASPTSIYLEEDGVYYGRIFPEDGNEDVIASTKESFSLLKQHYNKILTAKNFRIHDDAAFLDGLGSLGSPRTIASRSGLVSEIKRWRLNTLSDAGVVLSAIGGELSISDCAKQFLDDPDSWCVHRTSQTFSFSFGVGDISCRAFFQPRSSCVKVENLTAEPLQCCQLIDAEPDMNRQISLDKGVQNELELDVGAWRISSLSSDNSFIDLFVFSIAYDVTVQQKRRASLEVTGSLSGRKYMRCLPSQDVKNHDGATEEESREVNREICQCDSYNDGAMIKDVLAYATESLTKLQITAKKYTLQSCGDCGNNESYTLDLSDKILTTEFTSLRIGVHSRHGLVAVRDLFVSHETTMQEVDKRFRRQRAMVEEDWSHPLVEKVWSFDTRLGYTYVSFTYPPLLLDMDMEGMFKGDPKTFDAILRDCPLGLRFIHEELGEVHLNISSSTIGYNPASDRFVILDLDYGHDKSGRNNLKTTGAAGYTAPEALLDHLTADFSPAQMGPKADIFALGVVFACVLGRIPFPESIDWRFPRTTPMALKCDAYVHQTTTMLRRIKKGLLVDQGTPENVLLERMLENTVDRRLSSEDLVTESAALLRHRSCGSLNQLESIAGCE
ncbi:kinase domain-containing protein [Pochonia chlamydosporia 170]|uniref:Kinase domain-containing protein n=1 Tax=Pochonia chlamydosporia 170 TaxID=1380566 RepID=A0A179F0U6_METCM|nr:kinase domain-containing protein [Pochonia chlamydosporia 170]OAQ59022.1 kinase domain-containing protein [Pochonia chlamydosporia 170]